MSKLILEKKVLYRKKLLSINNVKKKKLLSTDMKFWRRSLRFSGLERKRNVDNIGATHVDTRNYRDHRKRLLVYFEYVNRVKNKNWTQILEWNPLGYKE